jgi:DHA1 family tetracycline resistance protein-like MFS transporter
MARTGDRTPTACLGNVMSGSGSKIEAAQYHPRSQYWPLYAAGFVTAFGAHSIAANLGTYGREHHATLLTVGLLLAIYDGAEVILKPVFGALVDRVGPRPVLLGGLVGFAAASAAFVIAGEPGLLGVARFGQGAAAAAFSPAASTLVARLTPTGGHGRRFGSYGAWKGLGYTLGPLAGGALVTLGGFTLLFSALCGLACCVAVWAGWVVPRVAPLPRRRSTVIDLARRVVRPEFLSPTLVLAASTAALSAGVGFLPVLGAASGMNAFVTGTGVSILSACAALAQPWAGRALDGKRLSYRAGTAIGLLLCAAGFISAATIPGLAGLLAGAIAIGFGAGALTPLGFAFLAASAPAERLGETMGAAEVGRELGDAGGPLLVGAIATASTLSTGLLGAAIALFAAAVIAPAGFSRDRPSRA